MLPGTKPRREEEEAVEVTEPGTVSYYGSLEYRLAVGTKPDSLGSGIWDLVPSLTFE